MTLEEMKTKLDEAQTDLNLRQAAIKARTEQARDLNRKNYDDITASSRLRTQIAQYTTAIADEEARLTTEAQPAGV